MHQSRTQWYYTRGIFVLCILALYACGNTTPPDITGPGEPGAEPIPGGPGQIAYIKQNLRTGSFHLHIVDPDGKNPINLNPIDDLAEYTGQSWSPDGTQLAFASNRSGNANLQHFSHEYRRKQYPQCG